ncbi:F420-dependent oxidoreductase, partial [Streptomyces sp. W16]|nr:F420-dependent oxidoreductase [Streptomyces sp. W16]
LRRALRFGDAWHGSGVDAEGLTGVRARLDALGTEVGRDPGELALTAGLFLVPPGFTPAVKVPGRPLGGADASAESVRDELGRLADAGLVSASLWLPVATEALPDALEWVARELVSDFSNQ